MPENQVKIQEEKLEQEVSQDTPELTEIEEQAMAEGWRPQEEFKGDPKKWVSADEFMKRKPLFEKIDTLKSENFHTRKEIGELKKVLSELTQHHKQVKQLEYQNALRDLREQRAIALSNEDHSRAVQLEEQIDEVRDEQQQFKQSMQQQAKEVAQVQPIPEYVEWVKDNSWYLTDPELHELADGFGQVAWTKNPKITPNELYEHITTMVKRAAPEKFASQSKARVPNTVESGNGESRPRKKDTYVLSPIEEEVARSFEKQGVMTRAEYIAELKKLDGR